MPRTLIAAVAVVSVMYLARAHATGLQVTSANASRPRRLYPTVDAVGVRRLDSFRGAASTSSQLTYHGGVDGIGVTTGHPQVYVVFWGSQWGDAIPAGSTNFTNDAAGVAQRVVALLAGIGTNNELWSGVMTEYCEDVPTGTVLCPSSAPHVAYATGGALAGVWADTATAAPTNATALDLGNEAIHAAAHFGNTTPQSNRNAQYVIVSAKGTHPDGFGTNVGFCAWHDYTGSAFVGASSPYGDIAFTNLPYLPDAGRGCGENFLNPGTAGLLDGVSIVEGHEFAETITDQNPGGGWWDPDGGENGDKCAWLTSGPGRVQNVPFATGSFAMQSTWANDGRACEISHPIWGVPGLPDDFALDISPASGFATPGETVSTMLETATVTGNPQTVQLTVSGGPPDATVTISPTSITTDDTATLTVATSSTTPFGQYTMTITATGSITHSTTYNFTVGPPPAPLQNGVAVSGIAGNAGSDQFWQIDVPADWPIVDFTIGGGSGDADLYVSRGTLPTDDQFDCRSVGPTTLDTCVWYGPAANRWYVRVHGAAAFSDVSLQATYAFAGRLFSRYRVFDLQGAAGSHAYFFIQVPIGARRLAFRTTGENGDVALYARLYALPTPFADACPPGRQGRKLESCTIKNPIPGFWYVALYGLTDFSSLTLKPTVR